MNTNDLGRAPSGQATHEPSPSVSALSGECPSRGMTDDQIKYLVTRFLTWKLPETFNPDGGISFRPAFNEGTPHEYKASPSGTNLFDATQAEAMVRHMIDGLPTDPSSIMPAIHALEEGCTAAVMQSVPEGHVCGVIHATKDQWEAQTSAFSAREQFFAAMMPTEQDALTIMHAAYTRLKKLDWNDAIYCPKDGSEFDVIEAGSTGVHKAHYSGEWPDGHWWVASDGDLWPSRPILYRRTEAEKARWAKFRDLAQGMETGTAETLAAPGEA